MCFATILEVSELSEGVITALFACPLDSASSSVNVPASTNPHQKPTPRLAEFIAYALHRTRLPDEITFQALFLLRRLKSRFPAARGSSGHRLFISALMLASKSSCDDTYSNKSWTVVSQGLFSLREVNQMERELFGYLGFKVNVEIEELTAFRNLLMTGDMITAVDCVSPQTSPNPATVAEYSSPSLDRGCDTPTAVQPRTTSVSVDSAPIISRRQSSSRRSNRASMSSYPGDTLAAAVAGAQNCSSSHYAQQQCQAATSFPPNDNNLSPSSASVGSSRGSFSSASGYSMTPSMTPSPSSMSHSESSSSRTTPDTPDADLEHSPSWSNIETKASNYYSGEPAGTYDSDRSFYNQGPMDLVLPSRHQHVYAATMADSNSRSSHPFHV